MARVVFSALVLAGLVGGCGGIASTDSSMAQGDGGVPRSEETQDGGRNEEVAEGARDEEAPEGGLDVGETVPPEEGAFEACVGETRIGDPLPVDVYFLLDRSASMDEPPGHDPDGPSQWDRLVSAIESLVRMPEAAGVGVGVQYFGLSDACNPETYAAPAVAVSPLPAAADGVVASIDEQRPAMQSPTYPALQGALEHMAARQAAHPARRAVVALATGSVPDQCGERTEACPECSTASSALESLARRFVEDHRVHTFGLTSGAGEPLRSIAEAGGGEVLSVDDGDFALEFLKALTAAGSVSPNCDYEIPPPPEGQHRLDLDQVRVAVRPPFEAEKRIPQVAGLEQCSGTAGWYLDDPSDPTTIVLCPELCEETFVGRVSIEIGCESVQ